MHLQELHVDLILLKLHDFDIILRMDWLETHHALVDCFAKKVTFNIPGQPEFSFERSSSDTPIQLISREGLEKNKRRRGRMALKKHDISKKSQFLSEKRVLTC